MLGIVLVMHAPLASAMASCVAHVMGAMPENFSVVDVMANDELELSVEHIKRATQEVETGHGVMFLTDLFGATPSNATVRAGTEMPDTRTVLVSGCNLPMLFRALGFRDQPVSQVAERLVVGGRNGIVSTGATAPQRQTFNPADQDDSARNQHQQ